MCENSYGDSVTVVKFFFLEFTTNRNHLEMMNKEMEDTGMDRVLSTLREKKNKLYSILYKWIVMVLTR